MRFQSTINLLVSHYEPAITDDVETPRYCSVVLKYDIYIGRKSPNGHFINLEYNGKYKGTLELSDRTLVDLDGFTVEGLRNIERLDEDEFMEWAIDIRNKKIILC